MSEANYSFPVEERLKHKKLFEAIFASGHRQLKHPLLAIWKETPLPEAGPIQVGFSVPKKHFKTAVERNRIKRWYRESFRTESAPLKSTLSDRGVTIALLFITLKTDNISYEAVRAKMVLLLQAIEREVANVE